MKRRLLVLMIALLCPMASAWAEMPKPDDAISVNLSTEGWVSTKTARVTVSVNAAVSAEQSGAARDNMMKTVQALSAKGDWKLTSFNRNQDETGLERWYATYEARLEETELGGLATKAKASGRAGMQLTVANIDFTPTLGEVEAVKSELRKNLLAQANKELDAVNASLPGRNFRIANVSFDGAKPPMPPQVMMMRGKMEGMMAQASSDMAMQAASVETAQRMQMTAEVTFAAAPAAKAP